VPVPKTDAIELPTGERIPILYEDRAVLAVDKPRRWMLVPPNWQKTPWNLQAAITSSIRAKDFWARSRGLKSLQFVHRLDADTTGVLLFVKHPNAVRAYSALFASREVEKIYLTVVGRAPAQTAWFNRSPIGAAEDQWGRMRIDPRSGKPAETGFRVLAREGNRALLEARPTTGRTHQIRVHLAAAGCPVLGDDLYGNGAKDGAPLALRSVYLAYSDPFLRRPVQITAPVAEFLGEYGFARAEPLVNLPTRPAPARGPKNGGAD
jgi:RluA family pseudouridine synthase